MLTEEEVSTEQRKDGKTAYRRILKLTRVPAPPTSTGLNAIAEIVRRAAKADAEKCKESLDFLGTIGKIKDLK
jgi:hypothetical protein